ncbi:TonB-dependent receptor [Aliifodinibius sp. S!AR15-10]|uniref:TonB-dependent receptor n=1 Tax=Aliifodinibius sp. S!AR15-10 TaxID=2950437 RepID=UPI00286184AB|nr:TonB-dependent receptor [Aliifodinibius sp. S!AR15-10]MDR8390888.1 TonB-dependent receptor [Aliifodinibius sp. S!AR15-10]
MLDYLKKKGILFLGTISLCLLAIPVYGQFSYNNAPLIEIINDLQNQTPYRFLYREAHINQVNLSFKSTEDDLLSSMRPLLEHQKIAMRVDTARKQVILFRSKTTRKTSRVQISGFVVDASTGERLPYATVKWKQHGEVKGTISNSAGYFVIDNASTSSKLLLTASYIGYGPSTAEINLGANSPVNDLTIRLSPESIDGNEIVVTGQKYFNSINEELERFVDIGSFSPFGETNTIRGLQQLPSVGMTTAMSDGIHVRGSSSDGFHVMLDGTSIFNQSHLFGLLDSFNSDVLRRSGLFYDIAPAQYQAPPGGTLSLLTKTGSLNNLSATAGFSNSSYRATIEGPIKKGKSSWLLSGRHSYMNTVDWLNNAGLVEWGLDIDRSREILEPNLVDVESRLITPGDYQARFYDLHGKLYFEGDHGGRFYVSGYYGADLTDQAAERLVRTFNDVANSGELSPINVETQNGWYNLAGSVHYENSISTSVFNHSMAGFSVYETDYSKEDFTYVQFDEGNTLMQAFVYPFANRSIINEFKAEESIDLDFYTFIWTIGSSYQYYLGEYYERSFDRPGFFSHVSSHKINAYTQLDFNGWKYLRMNAGARVHYFTNGSFLGASPRIKLELLPEQAVSFSFGYSRNYKFLHQVNLFNVVSSDVWVLSNESQPPSEVDYITTGLYLKPAPFTFLQAEAYVKSFDNLRLHEINTQSLTNTFAEAPWFFDNSGYGRGLELLLKNSFNRFSLTQTFTWSRMELENSRIRQGAAFPVEWDRTYRYSISAELNPVDNFHLYLSWMYASGTPNQLATFGPDTQKRLNDYYRTDLSLEYKLKTQHISSDLSVSFFNLFDRQNPWYREYSFVIDRTKPRDRLRTTPVTVFDLGFQPSFNFSLTF